MAAGRPRAAPAGAELRRRLRHFSCRDDLWEAMLRAANAARCSVDALIDEALRRFLTSRTARATVQQPADPGAAPATAPPRADPRPPRPPPLPAPRRLLLIVDGRHIPVDKDEFVIGRSATACDLTIYDGNISRRHAAILRRPEGHTIEDLGSTNGIVHRGRRVTRHRIAEGDVLALCDHELHFTYRGS